MALFVSVAVAVSCRVVPTILLGFTGVKDMDATLAMVNVVEPDIFPREAEIVVAPALIAEALPLLPCKLLIVAKAVFDELQVTELVRFWNEPSEYLPVAAKLAVVPGAMLLFAGETEIDVSVG